MVRSFARALLHHARQTLGAVSLVRGSESSTARRARRTASVLLATPTYKYFRAQLPPFAQPPGQQINMHTRTHVATILHEAGGKSGGK